MTTEYKAFEKTQYKALEEEGVIEAFVAVSNNTDLLHTRIPSGVLGKSLSKRIPNGVWMHNRAMPVAKTLEARECLPFDPRLPPALMEYGGLYIKGKFNLETEIARDVYSNIKAGIVDEFSIGFVRHEDKIADDGVRELLAIDVFEWSPCVGAVNPMTQLIGVKSLLDSLETELSFEEHSLRVESALKHFAARASGNTEVRYKAGREISDKSRTLLKGATLSIRQIADELDDLLRRSENIKTIPSDVIEYYINESKSLGVEI